MSLLGAKMPYTSLCCSQEDLEQLPRDMSLLVAEILCTVGISV